MGNTLALTYSQEVLDLKGRIRVLEFELRYSQPWQQLEAVDKLMYDSGGIVAGMQYDKTVRGDDAKRDEVRRLKSEIRILLGQSMGEPITTSEEQLGIMGLPPELTEPTYRHAWPTTFADVIAKEDALREQIDARSRSVQQQGWDVSPKPQSMTKLGQQHISSNLPTYTIYDRTSAEFWDIEATSLGRATQIAAAATGRPPWDFTSTPEESGLYMAYGDRGPTVSPDMPRIVFDDDRQEGQLGVFIGSMPEEPGPAQDLAMILAAAALGSHKRVHPYTKQLTAMTKSTDQLTQINRLAWAKQNTPESLERLRISLHAELDRKVPGLMGEARTNYIDKRIRDAVATAKQPRIPYDGIIDPDELDDLMPSQTLERKRNMFRVLKKSYPFMSDKEIRKLVAESMKAETPPTPTKQTIDTRQSRSIRKSLSRKRGVPTPPTKAEIDFALQTRKQMLEKYKLPPDTSAELDAYKRMLAGEAIPETPAITEPPKPTKGQKPLPLREEARLRKMLSKRAAKKKPPPRLTPDIGAIDITPTTPPLPTPGQKPLSPRQKQALRKTLSRKSPEIPSRPWTTLAEAEELGRQIIEEEGLSPTTLPEFGKPFSKMTPDEKLKMGDAIKDAVETKPNKQPFVEQDLGKQPKWRWKRTTTEKDMPAGALEGAVETKPNKQPFVEQDFGKQSRWRWERTTTEKDIPADALEEAPWKEKPPQRAPYIPRPQAPITGPHAWIVKRELAILEGILIDHGHNPETVNIISRKYRNVFEELAQNAINPIDAHYSIHDIVRKLDKQATATLFQQGPDTFLLLDPRMRPPRPRYPHIYRQHTVKFTKEKFTAAKRKLQSATTKTHAKLNARWGKLSKTGKALGIIGWATSLYYMAKIALEPYDDPQTYTKITPADFDDNLRWFNQARLQEKLRKKDLHTYIGVDKLFDETSDKPTVAATVARNELEARAMFGPSFSSKGFIYNVADRPQQVLIDINFPSKEISQLVSKTDSDWERIRTKIGDLAAEAILDRDLVRQHIYELNKDILQFKMEFWLKYHRKGMLKGRVTKILRGDTFMVEGCQLPIHLEGVKSDRKSTSTMHPQHQILSQKILGKTVLVKMDSGRHIGKEARVYFPDGRSVNKDIVNAGGGEPTEWYTGYDLPPKPLKYDYFTYYDIATGRPEKVVRKHRDTWLGLMPSKQHLYLPYPDKAGHQPKIRQWRAIFKTDDEVCTEIVIYAHSKSLAETKAANVYDVPWYSDDHIGHLIAVYEKH